MIDHRKIFQKGIIEQESVLNLLPVPVMIIIVIMNFPFAKDNILLFVGLAVFATIISSIVGISAKRVIFKEFLSLSENSTEKQIKSIKENTLRMYSRYAVTALLRWIFTPLLLIELPLILMNKIQIYEFWGFTWLTISTGAISVALFYLIDLKRFAEFFEDSSISKVAIELDHTVSLRKKIQLTLGLSVFYCASILVFLITFSIIGYIDLSKNIVGIVLSIFISLAMASVLGYYITNTIQLTVKSLSDSVDHFKNGSISSISSLAVTTPDEFGELVLTFNTLASRLQQRSSEIHRIGQGDLTHEIATFGSEDELGSSIKDMSLQLKNLISLITGISMGLKDGATTISDASLNLSQGSTEQAASIEEISSSIQELQSKAITSAENAKEVGDISTQNRTAGESGQEKMSELALIVSDVSSSADQMRKVIRAY